MKKILSIMIALIMLGGVALAVPNFQVDKTAIITGDWKYDGGWQQGVFQTGQYDFHAESNLATVGSYIETEKAGTPWKYELTAETSFNQAGNFYNLFSVITLNDPATTPATGGYSAYQFQQHNIGDFTESHLNVQGQGWGSVDTTFNADGAAYQGVYVNLNE